MRNKLVLLGSGITSLLLPLLTHAQAFSVSSSTEVTNNGAYLQAAYDRTINFLSSTGGFVFMLVLTILGIAVWLAVKAPRHVVNA